MSGCHETIFWAVRPCIVLEPIGAFPEGSYSRGVIHDLNLIYSVAAATLGLGFCLSLVFHGETESFIVTVSISPFTVIQGPHSWSPPLCRLVLWNWVLELHIYPCYIYICNFRLRVSTFLLVFFNSFAGKAFLVRSIKLCLVDNQRRSSVTIAGLRIVFD